jgi:hypothetical protein
MLKDLQLKNVIFLAIPKDVQSTGYAFSHPRVKKYIISKHDILSVFVWLIFVYFGLDPEDPDPLFPVRIRIQIQQTQINVDPCGSESATLVISIEKNGRYETSYREQVPPFLGRVGMISLLYTCRPNSSFRYWFKFPLHAYTLTQVIE